jgi:hypothetical protein
MTMPSYGQRCEKTEGEEERMAAALCRILNGCRRMI